MSKIDIQFIKSLPDAEAQKYADDFVAEEVVGASKIAEVVITVTDFKNVMTERLKGKNRGVGFNMRMIEVHNRVSLVPPISATHIPPQELHIKLGGATIRFLIVDANGNKDTYQALGIAFVLKGDDAYNTTGNQRIGSLNFDQKDIRPVGNSIYITDNFKDATGDKDYEFSIVIQNKECGAIGIIDPPIIHDPR